MTYSDIEIGIFKERINRFVAKTELDEELLTVHVKNTGRCRELLIEGGKVYLAPSDNPLRKTKYDLIAVEKIHPDGSSEIVNIDSQAPNAVAYEWLSRGNLFSGSAVIRREVKYGNSRFDLYVEDGDRRAFIEVKGVTLEENGTAMFPDAPTERGIKHVNELTACLRDGFEAYLLFVIQMKGVQELRPNDETHKAFGDALRAAKEAGVNILAYDCAVTGSSLDIESAVKVIL